MIFGNHSKNAVQKSDISILLTTPKSSLTKTLPNHHFFISKTYILAIF